MKIYLDSSSFAKRFIDEAGSAQVEEICAQATNLGLSVLCVPEITSALNRRLRERTITSEQYNSAKRHLLNDVRDAAIINLTPAVVVASIKILESNPSRTLDALHVASAQQWHAELFVSSDIRQLAAAKQAGLEIQNV